MCFCSNFVVQIKIRDKLRDKDRPSQQHYVIFESDRNMDRIWDTLKFKTKIEFKL